MLWSLLYICFSLWLAWVAVVVAVAIVLSINKELGTAAPAFWALLASFPIAGVINFCMDGTPGFWPGWAWLVGTPVALSLLMIAIAAIVRYRAGLLIYGYYHVFWGFREMLLYLCFRDDDFDYEEADARLRRELFHHR